MSTDAKLTTPWTPIGGGLEARHDGGSFVELRAKGSHFLCFYLSVEAVQKLLGLFPSAPPREG